MNVSPEEITARVQAGADWLDQTAPGWEAHVRPEALEMDSGFQCILGQAGAHVMRAMIASPRYLGRSYYAVSSEAKKTQPAFDPIAMGFDAPTRYVCSGPVHEYYAMLTCAWQALLASRETADA